VKSLKPREKQDMQKCYILNTPFTKKHKLLSE